MPIYTWRVSSYARNVFLYGNQTLSEIADQSYVEPVKQYAAKNFSQAQIDNAREQSWITQQEYDDTMVYKNAA